MTQEAANRTRLTPRFEWSPARMYLIVSGVLLLILAVGGFIINTAFPIGADEVRTAGSDHLFGIFEGNGWHSVAGLISGVVALGFAARPEWARFGALLKGAFYVGVTASFAIWGGETFWIASNNADQILHASLAAGGIFAGLLTPSSRSSAA